MLLQSEAMLSNSLMAGVSVRASFNQLHILGDGCEVSSYRGRRPPTLITGLLPGSSFLPHRGHLVSARRSWNSSSDISSPRQLAEWNSPVMALLTMTRTPQHLSQLPPSPEAASRASKRLSRVLMFPPTQGGPPK